MQNILKSLALVAGLVPAMAGGLAAEELVIAHAGDPASLDPAFRGDTLTGNVQRQIYDTILFRNADMSFSPMLAESVEMADATTWVIKLRPGIAFSNGEPIDAEAVKFSLDRIQNPDTKSPIRSWWSTITAIEIVDPVTLRMTTNGPDPLFEARMSLLAPVPPKYVREVGDVVFGQKPVSSGHYRLVEWRRDDALIFEINPDYYGDPAAYDRVAYRNIPEELSRIAALQTGEADVVTDISPTQAMALQGAQGFTVKGVPSTRVMTIQFDNTIPPGDNQMFREAVAHGVDRETINTGLMRGAGVLVNSLLSSAVPGWPRDKSFVDAYDPEKARAAAAASGVGDREIVLRLSAGQFPLDVETAQAIAAQLREVGLNIRVQPDERGVFTEDVRAHEVSPIYLMGQGNIWADPFPQINAFHATGGFLSAWTDPELDALLARSSEVAGAEREAVFEDVLVRLQETKAVVPLFAQQFFYGVSDAVAWTPRSDAQVFAFEMTPAN